MKIQELIARKSEILEAKKMEVHKSEPIKYTPKSENISKSLTFADEVEVKAIANTALWMDYHKDVLLPKCWEKDLESTEIPHLKDHNHTTEGLVGEIQSIWATEMSWKDLGIELEGETEVLAFSSKVLKAYDESTFTKYRRGMIKQHSIGMRYKDVVLAINPDILDEEENLPEEFVNWKKYINLVANKEDALESGYFFVVKEIELIEISAVLFGANKLTPTTEINISTTEAVKSIINNLKIKI